MHSSQRSTILGTSSTVYVKLDGASCGELFMYERRARRVEVPQQRTRVGYVCKSNVNEYLRDGNDACSEDMHEVVC